MPFTPFHLGPGALFKSAGGKRFSFMIFGGSQVLMDVEPLIRILQRDEILHGITHTVPGALVIGVVAGATGKPISEAILKWFGMLHVPITWAVSFWTALIGTMSHILLDGVMHRDMVPFWPFIAGNPLLELVDVGLLHVMCAICAVIGGIAVAVRWSMRNDQER
jgi:hypothetical protein